MSIVFSDQSNIFSPFGLVLLLSGSMERKGHLPSQGWQCEIFKINTLIIFSNKKDAYKRLFYWDVS